MDPSTIDINPAQVIYNLLEWGAGGDGGRRGLIMIGLSNTVDLPERVMQVKLTHSLKTCRWHRSTGRGRDRLAN